ncbi:MAG: hypothetical protein HY547_09245 [Elusimicrobia bacterium]|nr:hypothetical protein [Elusimicrobiota bacterium]
MDEKENPKSSLTEEEKELERLGYPGDLAKACIDNCFFYALELKNGWIIEFSGASPINEEWVHLDLTKTSCGQCERLKQTDKRLSRFCFERGLDVRVSEIIWCADAPHGS